jgi:hypothetical protein
MPNAGRLAAARLERQLEDFAADNGEQPRRQQRHHHQSPCMAHAAGIHRPLPLPRKHQRLE